MLDSIYCMISLGWASPQWTSTLIWKAYLHHRWHKRICQH